MNAETGKKKKKKKGSEHETVMELSNIYAHHTTMLGIMIDYTCMKPHSRITT